LLARKGDTLLYLRKFTKRVLTEPERAYFFNRFGPKDKIETNLENVSEFLAGRLVKHFSHRISRLIHTDSRPKKQSVRHATN
jgi:hypothetical protein